jgi:hypothetical protein
MKERGVAGSKMTLNQYLKHLIREDRIRKIVSPVKGKRVAYEIISEEDLFLAEQAKAALIKAALNRQSGFILPSYPSLDPLDPRAIHIFRRIYESEHTLDPEKFISKEMNSMACIMLGEMKIQMERYREIKRSGEIEKDRVWIESSFNRLKSMMRAEFAKIALLLLTGHYKYEELVDAMDVLHQEYHNKKQDLIDAQ